MKQEKVYDTVQLTKRELRDAYQRDGSEYLEGEDKNCYLCSNICDGYTAVLDQNQLVLDAVPNWPYVRLGGISYHFCSEDHLRRTLTVWWK